MCTPLGVSASELAKSRLTEWFRTRVLSAGSPWEPRGSWHGARVGLENSNIHRFRKTKPYSMKSNRLRSKPASIAKARWAAYATAGAASAFTCANSAKAAIHYSGLIHEYFGSECDKSASFQLDQPADSIRLRHNLQFCNTASYGGTAFFSIRGRAGAS